MKKWFSFLLAIVLVLTFVACSSDVEDVDNIEDVDVVEEQTTPEPQVLMDWSIFESIGVDAGEAERIFTKLGFPVVKGLKQIGTSTINYKLYPAESDEYPINIMVEQGVITQVAFRHLCVDSSARKAFFDKDELPERFYYSTDDDYWMNREAEIGVIMYDLYLYNNPFYIGVDLANRKLFYFE